MNDIEETPATANGTESSNDVAAKPKRKGISVPFLIVVALVGVGAYFGVKQYMYNSMLGEMQKEVEKEVFIDQELRDSIDVESLDQPPSPGGV